MAQNSREIKFVTGKFVLESSDVQIEEPVGTMWMEHDGETSKEKKRLVRIYMGIHWMIINLK
jgi:hypothetical protein